MAAENRTTSDQTLNKKKKIVLLNHPNNLQCETQQSPRFTLLATLKMTHADPYSLGNPIRQFKTKTEM